MEEADILQVSQLLQTMKELALKLQAYEKKGNSEKVFAAKNEILAMQRKIDEMLR